jgi:hypothetical protein
MSIADLLNKAGGKPFHALTPDDALRFIESLRLERAMNPGHGNGTKKRRVVLPKPDAPAKRSRKEKKTELDRFIASLSPEEKASFFQQIENATKGASNVNATVTATDSQSLGSNNIHPQS